MHSRHVIWANATQVPARVAKNAGRGRIVGQFPRPAMGLDHPPADPVLTDSLLGDGRGPDPAVPSLVDLFPEPATSRLIALRKVGRPKHGTSHHDHRKPAERPDDSRNARGTRSGARGVEPEGPGTLVRFAFHIDRRPSRVDKRPGPNLTDVTLGRGVACH
jgi:hypothetical protein